MAPSRTLLLGGLLALCSCTPTVSADTAPATDQPDASAARPCPLATAYLDADGDGVGTTAAPLIVCSGALPAGYSAEGGDCDDTDPERFQSGCADHDGDGSDAPVCMGEANDTEYPCGSILEHVPGGGQRDCDDGDPDANDYFYRDADGDGSGAGGAICTRWRDGYSPFGGDCDDGDRDRGPNANELFDDGVDSDCDGSDHTLCGGLDSATWAPAGQGCTGIDLALGALGCSSCFITRNTLLVVNRGAARTEGHVRIRQAPSDAPGGSTPIDLVLPVALAPGEARPLATFRAAGLFTLTLEGVSDCDGSDNSVYAEWGHCL